MLVAVSQMIFCRFFECLLSNGAKFQIMVLSGILIHSSLVFSDCFLNQNLPILYFLRFVTVCGSPISKWSTINANHPIKINKKIVKYKRSQFEW